QNPGLTVVLSLIAWVILQKAGTTLVKWARWFFVLLICFMVPRYLKVFSAQIVVIGRELGIEKRVLDNPFLDANWYEGFMTGAAYAFWGILVTAVVWREFKLSNKKIMNIDAKTTGTVT
ncbi:hypothetical protein JW992_02530, partial [candidate division KSB1 bacterium]|nr:hypothetical protein [candidate division KSB1 bacterium]